MPLRLQIVSEIQHRRSSGTAAASLKAGLNARTITAQRTKGTFLDKRHDCRLTTTAFIFEKARSRCEASEESAEKRKLPTLEPRITVWCFDSLTLAGSGLLANLGHFLSFDARYFMVECHNAAPKVLAHVRNCFGGSSEL